MDVVGFARVQNEERDVVRYLVLRDFSMVAETEIPAEVLTLMMQALPLLDKEQRSTHLQTAFLLQLRTMLDKQSMDLQALRQEIIEQDIENVKLRAMIFKHGIEVDDASTSAILVRENEQLRAEKRDWQRAQVESFRETLDVAAVATVQATLIKLSRAIWSFAPLSKGLASHNDSKVRESYSTNLSLLTMMQELAETALQTCDDLISV